jgi:hypothetical protein
MAIVAIFVRNVVLAAPSVASDGFGVVKFGKILNYSTSTMSNYQLSLR